MIKTLLFLSFSILGLCFLSCKKENRKILKPENITVDENLSKNDTFKILSKYPELKLFNSEKVESATRTAYILQISSFSDGYYHTRSVSFEDYKCKTEYKGDTISIWLNNYNGYFGNGVLIKVFNDQFLIQDINPKTLKGEIKFINSYPVYQKLVLNKYPFQKNDSIYGFIDYETKLDSLVTKNFRGHFRTKIK
ncbi:hypothetical protein [uncultured Chryseobacterium sp.]|uniref:hypothetical protein n=1 Tax=uncultured Chryseobacterium sp. TaxID=259322 RepID=UPI0025865FD3|nr:hypothetical protein [uncultured Chryseobacterium sp.]